MKRFAETVALCCIVLMLLWSRPGISGAQGGQENTDDMTTRAVQAAPAAMAGETAKAPQNDDPERVIVTVNGEPLRAWQLEAIMEYGDEATKTEVTAAKMWIETRLKAAVARQRGLHEERKVRFILDLAREYCLANAVMGKMMTSETGKVSRQEVRDYYEQHKDRYGQLWTMRIQHIRVRDRQLAEDIADKARQSDADFDELVQQYSKAYDRPGKGQIDTTEDFALIKRALGLDSQATETIRQAGEGDVLGPFMGNQGFEIVYVKKITPEKLIPFEEARESIREVLELQVHARAFNTLYKKFKDKAEIVKSEELKALEQQARQEAQQPARRPPRIGRPR